VLVPEAIVPPEISSSEYYHKLQAMGLAYESLNFRDMEALGSE
jgi:hypothetical protein